MPNSLVLLPADNDLDQQGYGGALDYFKGYIEVQATLTGSLASPEFQIDFFYLFDATMYSYL